MGAEEEMTFRIILETRYHMMGSLAKNSGFPVFVDLPCGYTPRAIEIAERNKSYLIRPVSVRSWAFSKIIMIMSHPYYKLDLDL